MNQAALRAVGTTGDRARIPGSSRKHARVLVAARQEANQALRAATTRQKFEFDAATACLVHQVGVQSIAADEALDDGQRIMKIREELFGPDFAEVKRRINHKEHKGHRDAEKTGNHNHVDLARIN